MRRVHMSLSHMSLSLALLAGIAAGGCSSTTATPAASTQPAATAAPAPTPTPPAKGPAAAMVTPPAAKDLTHVLTKDEPYYASEPTPGMPMSGTLKAGSKVLLLIPGTTYSQVISDTGISAYMETDGLKPLGK